MEQLIFFGIIIFLTVVESIARKRREAEKGLPAPHGGDDDSSAERGVPGHGVDPSLDPDGDGIPGQPRAEYTRPYGAGGQAQRSAARSSETLIPEDIWKEIENLARGGGAEPSPRPTPTSPAPSRIPESRPSEPRPAGPEGPRVPTPAAEAPAGRATGTVRPAPRPGVPARRAPAPATPARPDHRVHLSHAGYGTDPSERAPSEQDNLDPLAATLGADAAAVRRMLTGRADALRQAVILHEVLGPPAAMRDE